jgi:hypothetical protein
LIKKRIDLISADEDDDAMRLQQNQPCVVETINDKSIFRPLDPLVLLVYLFIFIFIYISVKFFFVTFERNLVNACD